MELNTDSLRLLPFSPVILLALIDGPQAFQQKMGMPIAKGLREVIVEHVSPAWIDQLRSSSTADIWLHGYAVVDKKDRLVVGTAGFKGPPSEQGVVEIGYGIAPIYGGRGYATQAAEALVAFAFTHHTVQTVCAHTLPASNASTRVLTKCGFAYVGDVQDPDDGPVWRWERTRDKVAQLC